MMSGGWYVQGGGNEPLSDQQLDQAARLGLISPDTMISQGSPGSWVPAKYVSALVFATAPESAAKDRTADGPDADFSSRFGRPVVICASIAAVVTLVVVLGLVLHERGRPAASADLPVPAVSKLDHALASNSRRPRAPNVPQATAAIEKRQTKPEPTPEPLSREPLVARKPVPIASATETPPSRFRMPVPPPVAPPIARTPVKRVDAKDSDLRALEQASRQSRTARDAVDRYAQFAATHRLSEAQTITFQKSLGDWKERSSRSLVRLGTKWVTGVEARKAHEEAASLVKKALQVGLLLNYRDTRKMLEKASRTDPNSVMADYCLGILESLPLPVTLRNYKTAEKHYREMLRRRPEYVPALNNLAIVEVRLHQYDEAVKHWRRAIDLPSRAVEPMQNLGRFVSEAKRHRIHPSSRLVTTASELYANALAARHQNATAQLDCGWLYIPPVLPKGERTSQPEGNGATQYSDFADGTGFVIADHIVLTCRHVVESADDGEDFGLADRIEILDPADQKHERRLEATLLSVSDDRDLSVLRCDQLSLKPVALSGSVPPRGTDVLAIGFPGGRRFGATPKVTRGVITALPGAVPTIVDAKAWQSDANLIWFDASVSTGVSGGPICDERGNVVAIAAAIRRASPGVLNAVYSAGTTAADAIAFFRKSLPSAVLSPCAAAPLKWPDVDAKVSPSTVLIVSSYRKAVLETASARRGGLFEDRVCTACGGLAVSPCSAPGCNKGLLAIVDAAGRIVPTRCPVCGGTGFVNKCPHCRNGFDPLLP